MVSAFIEKIVGLRTALEKAHVTSARLFFNHATPVKTAAIRTENDGRCGSVAVGDGASVARKSRAIAARTIGELRGAIKIQRRPRSDDEELIWREGVVSAVELYRTGIDHKISRQCLH